VRITEPSSAEVANPSTYFNRKGFFAIAPQAMCDAHYRFTFVSAKTPGSTHDAIACRVSSLAALLDSGELAPKYWVAADDAYVCGRSILTPHSIRNLSVANDCYNFYQSSARIRIEQAFGQLVGR
jgi:DDE superfamily endonuclease